MTASITFAIPFHRDIDLLRLAVESVLAQTNSDWCLLVCDDSGSELPIEAMLESFADTFNATGASEDSSGTARRNKRRTLPEWSAICRVRRRTRRHSMEAEVACLSGGLVSRVMSGAVTVGLTITLGRQSRPRQSSIREVHPS